MPKRILLADDSVTIQKVVELTFMDQDYEVEAVSNGDEAISRLESGSDFDLVIADVHMPGANGFEVCRSAKALVVDLPVLLLVGTFEPFVESDAEECGANSFLRKPFDSQQLLGLAESLLSARAAAEPEWEEGEAEAGAPTLEAEPAPPAEISPEPGAPELEAVWSVEEPVEPEEGEPEVSEEPFAAEELFEISPETSEEEGMEPPIEALEAAEEAPDQEGADEYAGPFEGADEEIPEAEPVDLEEDDYSETEDALQPEPYSEEPEAGQLVEMIDAVSEELTPGADEEQPEPPAATAWPEAELSTADVERIARRLVELLGDTIVREIAWDVLPDLAEVVIKERIRELESQLE